MKSELDDATFGPGTVRALVEAASRDGVAAAGGELEFRSGPTGFSLGQRAYRWLEHRLRSAESALGVCVRTDATCTAYRKSLWEPIEAFEDLDQSFPFVARRAGLRVVIAEGAKVTDEPNVTARQELRARARMTRKTLLSFRRRWGLRDALRHPGFTLAFVNHKLVRFLSPVAVAGLLVALGWVGGLPVRIGLALLLFASIALPRIFPFSLLHAFLVANAGFALGVVQWFTGDRSGSIR